MFEKIYNLTEDVNNADRIYDSQDAPLPSEFLLFRLLWCILENVMFSWGQINQTLVWFQSIQGRKCWLLSNVGKLGLEQLKITTMSLSTLNYLFNRFFLLNQVSQGSFGPQQPQGGAIELHKSIPPSSPPNTHTHTHTHTHTQELRVITKLAY